MRGGERWEAVDALLEWLHTSAPLEAEQAAANRRLNREFHAGLARRLLTLAVLARWRLDDRRGCAAAAARLGALDPTSPVVERLRRDRPDIARLVDGYRPPVAPDPPPPPGPRLSGLTANLARALQHDDLRAFADACVAGAEESLAIALG